MILSQQYSWEESEKDITVHIPFRGKSIKKATVFVSDCILRVSHPPSYILDLNLKESIRTASCKAVVRDGVLFVNIQKTTPGLWVELIYTGGTKEEIRKRRDESVRRREDEIRQQHEKARSKKLEEERMVVRNQVRCAPVNCCLYHEHKNTTHLLELKYLTVSDGSG